jgi:hypothetical protein
MGFHKFINIGNITHQLKMLGKLHNFISYLLICFVFFKNFKAVYELEAQCLPYSISRDLGNFCSGLSNVSDALVNIMQFPKIE